MVMFQYSICDMHFGIIKFELIWGIFVEILLAFSDKLLFLNSIQSPLFANKKKGLVRIELMFLQEVSIIVRVNMKPFWYFFLSILLLQQR